jgi:hypothetical protein
MMGGVERLPVLGEIVASSACHGSRHSSCSWNRIADAKCRTPQNALRIESNPRAENEERGFAVHALSLWD